MNEARFREIEEEQINRIKFCRIKLLRNGHVGTHTLMGGLPIISHYEIPTFATNGQIIYANIGYAESISQLEVSGVLFHEALHIGLEHHVRMIPLLERGISEPLIQTALDYVVNAMIMESANYGIDFKLPEGCLYKPKYSGWSAENVIKDLLDQGWDDNDEEGGPSGPEGYPGPAGENGDSGDDSDDQQEGGSGQGEDDANDPSQSGQSSQPGNNKTQENICRPGDVLPAPGLEDGTVSMEEAKQEIRHRIQQAADQEKMIGSGAGNLISGISDNNRRNQVPSDEIVRFMAKVRSSTKSFSRPKRRFLQRQIYLPTPKKKRSILHVCIDTSGSVTMDETESYLANIICWAAELGLDLIRIAYVDTKVHKCEDTDSIWHDTYLAGGSAASMELITIGGGGTSFDPIFKAIEEDGEEVAGLIYMTDGCGSVRSDEPHYPVMWLTSHEAPQFYPSSSLWGEVVYLENQS